MRNNRIHDLEGQTHGYVTVTKYLHCLDNKAWWECECQCGNTVVAHSTNITNGTASCGCRPKVIRNKIRSESWTKYRKLWMGIKYRCEDSKCSAYFRYGGRGIYVSSEWQDASSFIDWCIAQEPIPEGYTIDRLDNDGPYSPGNCAFRSKTDQGRNTRSNRTFTYRGSTLTISELIEKFKVPDITYQAVIARLNSGWSIEDALEKPAQWQATQLTYNGVTDTLKGLSQRFGKADYKTIFIRVKKGWGLEESLETPPQNLRRKRTQ